LPDGILLFTARRRAGWGLATYDFAVIFKVLARMAGRAEHLMTIHVAGV
jgi:hypothetical protein